MDSCCSRLIVATVGITAGSCFATTELRLLMLDIIDDTFVIWKSIEFALYVDDATISSYGQPTAAAAIVAGATDHVANRLEKDLLLEVSITKSVVAASTFSVAELTAYFSVTGKIKPAHSAKLLGTSSGGGKKRSVVHSVKWVREFGKRTRRIRTLRKLSVKVRQLVRAAGTPAVTYGCEIMGFSDSHLALARGAIATAAAPESGGKNPSMVLYALDAQGSTLDPEFDCHVLPYQNLCLGALASVAAHWHHA